jgi:hypothetical protein
MSVSNFTELDQLQPPGVVDDHYMLLPIERGFDWKTCFANVSAGEWYLVAFRSKHRQEVDKTFLYWLDHKATLAAQQTPGFLYYFHRRALSQRRMSVLLPVGQPLSRRSGSSAPRASGGG